MPATDVRFAIQRHNGAFIESLETDRKVEPKLLKGSSGNVIRIKATNPTTDFNVKGYGTTAVVPGIGNPGISTISSGESMIESLKESESNDDWASWEYSGTNYPFAQSVA